ncbi:oxidoreductase [Dermatobacter hominis]|uniref:oxidoreductase n=1 Tax=Dermatobacter hominis TaxID=2884263 RepID=UPI001D118D5F|nr:oxidoreductase [Dermatobacter hominis]UDY35149.1 SDR family NAD(P)-dependent oxidoreductase [Dermatobacter hominis]
MADGRWDEDDIPDQTGRVAVVTGANSGLGLETARQLAAHGATVVLAVRSLDRGAAAVEDIASSVPDARLELQQLDLASLSSVRAAAEAIGGAHPRIDLLVNNAGVMYTERQLTAEGFELQFGTNHLGHFALTGLLLDRIVGVDGSRVVTVASLGHWAPFAFDLDDVRAEDRYNRFAAYSRSKLANLMFTYELHRRLVAAGAPTAALAAHPGGSDTELARHVPFSDLMHSRLSALAQSAAMGALPTLRAATDPTAGGGQYYGPDRLFETRGHPIVVRSSRRSQDRGLQALLWARSEELTGVRPL